MQIVFHCGVHGTDHDGLLKTLMQNREWLHANGVEMVSRNRHRGVFESALSSLRGGPATREMEEMMLDAILDGDQTRRVICSQPGFLGVVDRAISANGLFAAGGERLQAMANLFPTADVEIFLAMKNPATLIPYCISQMNPKTYHDVMPGISPESLRWGPAISRMVQSLRGRRLVLWCHEDTPLIWPEVVRTVAGMPGDVPLKAGLQVLSEILEPDGIRFIRDEMAKQERMTIPLRREIFAKALALHARPERVDEEIDLPGWTQELVDRITRLYDQDVAEIAGMPGVELISP